jgi:hypothetical protein
LSKKIVYLLSGLLVILILLAVVLPGQAKAVVLGLLFICGFIALFGGLGLLANYLNEQVFPRPRNPTHLCHHCLSLYQNPEEQTCEYCLSEFGMTEPLYLLKDFLETNSADDLDQRLRDLEQKLKLAGTFFMLNTI